MTAEVKACVDSRVNFIREYLTVTSDTQNEFDRFIADISTLGERCSSCAEFEEKFISEGLNDRFNALVLKSPAKAHKMTKEEKQFEKETFKQMMSENKRQIVTDVAEDVTSSAMLYAEGEMLKHNREKMIQEGTFDDYTRTSNAVSDAKRLLGFIKNCFKK